MSSTPWDLYAEQLFPVGYGHPLWIPEPNEHQREVDVGDVGWLKEGEFRALFNSMKPEHDPVNTEKGVPLDFNMFNPKNVSIGQCAKITQQLVCSRSIRTIEAHAELTGGGGITPASAGGGFKFQSMTDSGAFVLLEPPGQSRDIESKRHVVNYMRDNFDKWLEFANASYSWGLDLKDQDIIFVCGTTKTTRWAVASFQGNTYRKKEGYVSGDFGPFATAGLSVNISNQILPAHHYRHGPLPQGAIASAPQLGHSSYPATRQPDQCLFIHYYKMKRRFWWKEPMQAAAGPHQLSPAPDNPGMDAPMVTSLSPPYEFEPDGGYLQVYDPVNHLLDYILQQSEAEVAISSDLDLTAIFTNQEFPDNIPAALERLKPVIEVDERGVGTISVDYRINKKRRNDDQVEKEAHKRARPIDDSPSTSNNDILMPNVPLHPSLTSSLLPTSIFTDGGGNQGDLEGGLPPAHLVNPAPFSSIIGGLPANEDVPMADGKEGEYASKLAGATASDHDGSVTSLVYSHDGRLCASGSEGTSIIIWDIRAHTTMHTLTGHQNTVSALAFSRDNTMLASASHDTKVILWNVKTGQVVRWLQLETPVHSLAFTPDGSKLIAGSSDGKLHIWDTATYNNHTFMGCNVGVVTFIIFSSNGKLMVTGGTESVCYVWKTEAVETVELLCMLNGHRGMVCAAAFASDNRRVITASDDGSSRIWNAETGETLVILHEHAGPVWAVAFSPDAKRVATGSSDSTVQVCDSYTGKRLLSLDGHDNMINAVAFSLDGMFIASASADNTVRLWSAVDGSLLTTYNEHNDNVTLLLFSPDGRTFASSAHDGTVYIRQFPSMVETCG